MNVTRQAVFDFIVRYKREHDGNSPTTREIAEACCLSASTVSYHLVRLELDNRVQLEGDRRRQIKIVGGSWDLMDSMRPADEDPAADQENHDTSLTCELAPDKAHRSN